LRRGRITPFVVSALLVAPVVGLVLRADPDAHRRAPALPGTVLAGKPVTLEQLRGKPVVVHFWASWCVPCREEAPEIAALPEQLRGRATLVGIATDDGHDASLAFIRRHRWRFSIVEDTHGVTADDFGLIGLPTTYIIDARGRVVDQLRGPQTAAWLRERLGV
jgi:cytochrome c biogenesis protein CcmG/thiol:disulfide interchange protein DsbE